MVSVLTRVSFLTLQGDRAAAAASGQLCTLSMMPHGMEYSFGWLGATAPAVQPPSFLWPSSLLLAGREELRSP